MKERSIRTVVYFTEEEKRRIDRALIEQGEKISPYIRRVVMGDIVSKFHAPQVNINAN